MGANDKTFSHILEVCAVNGLQVWEDQTYHRYVCVEQWSFISVVLWFLPNDQTFYCMLAGWRNVDLPVAAAHCEVMWKQLCSKLGNKLCSKWIIQSQIYKIWERRVWEFLDNWYLFHLYFKRKVNWEQNLCIIVGMFICSQPNMVFSTLAKVMCGMWKWLLFLWLQMDCLLI